MAKLTKKEIEKIIKRDAPGHRVVEDLPQEDVVSTRVKPDDSTPDLAALRRKYLGADAADAPDLADDGGSEFTGNPGEDAAEDELVAIEPESSPSPWDHGSKPKVVVISGKDKRIIASQG